MGNHTFLGSPTSLQGIAQPNSIVVGRSLRQNLKDTSTKRTPDKGRTGAASSSPGHDYKRKAPKRA
jgi:hypothetical protein